MSVVQSNRKSVVLEILEHYKTWLEILNYSAVIIKNNPRYVREFIDWANLTDINQVNQTMLQSWFDHLASRKHKRKEGALSLNYLKGYRNALSQFSRFLRETGRRSFEVEVDFKCRQDVRRAVLTRQEIKKLYEATECYPDPMIKDKGLLAARERAILGLFYGCGLRKNEGMHVETGDVDFKQNLLHVRKGKNYKERYVPIPDQVKKDFIHYLNYARPQLMRGRKHDCFLTGWYGSPLKGSALLDRVHVLAEIARIDKPVGLHTLRHSVATHLLESGMKLEQIARFLGHSSLESTQIYTHLSAEM